MSIFDQTYQHPLDEARDKFMELIKISKNKTHGINRFDQLCLYSNLIFEIYKYKGYFENRGIITFRIHIDRNKWYIFKKKIFHVIVKIKVSPRMSLDKFIDIDI